MTQHEKTGVNSSLPRARRVQRTSVPVTGRGAMLDCSGRGTDVEAELDRVCVSVQGGAGAQSRAPGGDLLPHTEGAQGKGEC